MTSRGLEREGGRGSGPAISERGSLIKRLLPRSLLGRSFLIIMLPLVLLQVISTWIFYDRHYDTITRRLAQGVAGDIAAVIAMMERQPDPESRKAIFALAQTTLRLQLEFLEGEILPVVAPPAGSILQRKLAHALESSLKRPFTMDTERSDERVEIQVQLPTGIMRALISRERLFSSTTYIFIMWMVGTSVVLFVVAMIFMRNQVRPIRRLAMAAEAFGRGLDAPHFKPEGASEVRQAARAFLRMRERIRRQIQQRTEMLAGVSHDLRTPLTRMKLQLALLGDREAAESLRDDVQEMEKMVDGYLAFARGEGAEQPLPSDLGALVEEVIGQMRKPGAPINLKGAGELLMPLRRDAMRRCLTNLIGNAQRFAKRVEVTIKRRSNAVEILIDDDGPGIAPTQREEVFRPFHRLEQSRNPATGGTGLGLTIARDLVRGHGGDLSLDDSPLGGLRARIWLPL